MGTGDNGICDELKSALNQCRLKLKSTEQELEETRKKKDWAVKEMECLACEVMRPIYSGLTILNIDSRIFSLIYHITAPLNPFPHRFHH